MHEVVLRAIACLRAFQGEEVHPLLPGLTPWKQAYVKGSCQSRYDCDSLSSMIHCTPMSPAQSGYQLPPRYVTLSAFPCTTYNPKPTCIVILIVCSLSFATRATVMTESINYCSALREHHSLVKHYSIASQLYSQVRLYQLHVKWHIPIQDLAVASHPGQRFSSGWAILCRRRASITTYSSTIQLHRNYTCKSDFTSCMSSGIFQFKT
jgi:hypothetical protein